MNTSPSKASSFYFDARDVERLWQSLSPADYYRKGQLVVPRQIAVLGKPHAPDAWTLSMSLKRKREESENRVEDLAHSSLTLQAYEARIRPAQEQRAVKLTSGRATQISGLIEWSPAGNSEVILVDRYDARLLLSEGLGPRKHPQPPQTLPKYSRTEEGWDDLPSDYEDLFFFSRDEAEDIRKEKRRKTIESNRQARLAALRAEEDSVESAEHMNPSDEEPDVLQLALMKKTAVHIASSPNSLQLEMRILANHGSDQRFAFLRGRWKNAWKEVKREVQTEKSSTKPPTKDTPASDGLVTYDDSGDDEDETEERPSTQPFKNDHLTMPKADDARIKAERRARVKEWSLKRKNLVSIDKKENT